MGKSNYSIMQRYGLSLFWKNSWISNLNYHKFYFLFLTSERIVENIIVNFIKYSVINKNLRSFFKNKYNIKFNYFKSINPFTYVGRITFFKISNWIILSINLVFKNKFIKNKRRKLNLSILRILKKKSINELFYF